MRTCKNAVNLKRDTVLRNLSSGVMPGYINKDDSGLLHDDKSNFHSVNTRW
jgi:hypothetical protein